MKSLPRMSGARQGRSATLARLACATALVGGVAVFVAPAVSAATDNCVSTVKGFCTDVNGIDYALSTSGPHTATVSGWNGTSTSVVIPRSVTKGNVNYTVTAIAPDAFYYVPNLVSLSIPNSVTSIGEYAVAYDYLLTAVDIPNSVTTIGAYAFYYDDSVQSFHLSDSVQSIGSEAFYDDPFTNPVTLPKTLTSLGDGAFYDDYKMSGLKIDSGLTSIPSTAFEDDSSFTSLDIPSSVTSVGSSAFEGDYGLTSLGIPSSVTSVGANAFEEDYSLTSLKVGDPTATIGSEAFYDDYGLVEPTNLIADPNVDATAFGGDLSALKTVAPPSPDPCTLSGPNCDDAAGLVFTLSGSAPYVATLAGVPAGTSTLKIPSTVSYGGQNYSVTSIGAKSVYEDYALSDLTIPDTVTSIGDEAFEDDYALTHLVIPVSLTTIGQYAFYGIYALKSVTGATSLTTIGDEAFEDDYVLTTLTLGPKLTTIGESAFEDDYILAGPITVPASLTTIEQDAFYDDSVTLADPPGHVAYWSAMDYGPFPTSEVADQAVNEFTTTATWMTTHPVTIHFESKGGSKVANLKGDSGNIVTLPVPTRTGHTFIAWFSAARGGKVVKSPYLLKKTVTLYARWT